MLQALPVPRFVPASEAAATPWIALADWPARREAVLAGGSAVADAAVLLPPETPDEALEALAADLPRIARVGLSFGKWVDGRGYSLARLLRRRYRYTGEVLATGEVLVDMVPLLVRCGVDAVALQAGQNEAHARRALGFFEGLGHYQGDGVEPLPRFRRVAEDPSPDATAGAAAVVAPLRDTPVPTPQPGRAIALYARPSAGHARRLEATVERLRAAAQAHPGRIVFASSLGAEDQVITDLIARHRLPIAIGTLVTGRLHAQTLALIDRTETHYAPQVEGGLHIERWAPPEAAVVQWVARHGADSIFGSIEQRKACCALRKLEPLSRMLAGRSAWITGLRREQSDARGEVPFEQVDADGRVKHAPLADWTWGDVWHHLSVHGVPTNPLHDAFMPSIGCEPCTRAIAVGEPFRSGRWWWEDETAKECGLHAAPAPTAA